MMSSSIAGAFCGCLQQQNTLERRASSLPIIITITIITLASCWNWNKLNLKEISHECQDSDVREVFFLIKFSLKGEETILHALIYFKSYFSINKKNIIEFLFYFIILIVCLHVTSRKIYFMITSLRDWNAAKCIPVGENVNTNEKLKLVNKFKEKKSRESRVAFKDDDVMRNN